MRCPGWPCDTQHAIQPNLIREQSSFIHPSDLAEQIISVGDETGCWNICFTGGEPFLQPQEDLTRLLGHLVNEHDDKPLKLEVFTNGSFPFNEVPGWRAMNYMMDWKLGGSGEAGTKVEQRKNNARLLGKTDGIKFVVKDEEDLFEAIRISMDLESLPHWGHPQFWVGRAWDDITDTDIIDFILTMKLPWRLNVQVHKYIWPADERGV
jgi:7-carboxy-7-deazaguanine synthase